MENKLDLGPFEGHTPPPWDVKSIAIGFPGKEDPDIRPEMFGPNCSLATAAPVLLAELKEARKERHDLIGLLKGKIENIQNVMQPNDSYAAGKVHGLKIALELLEGKE